MGWSLNYQNLRKPDRLNSFLLSVGKALYLANAFEYKCKYVLQMFKLVRHIDAGNSLDSALTLTDTMKNKVLGKTLIELERFPAFSKNDIALLDRAREARNFIAHKGALVPLEVSRLRLQHQITELKNEVIALVPGDNIVSRWICEIEDNAPAPQEIQRLYPHWVEKWVFSDSAKNNYKGI